MIDTIFFKNLALIKNISIFSVYTSLPFSPRGKGFKIGGILYYDRRHFFSPALTLSYLALRDTHYPDYRTYQALKKLLRRYEVSPK